MPSRQGFGRYGTQYLAIVLTSTVPAVLPRTRADDLAVLQAKIKIKNLRIRAGIGPKPTISLGQWQSGPSPGTPRAKEKIKNHFKHSQDDFALLRGRMRFWKYLTPWSLTVIDQVGRNQRNAPATAATKTCIYLCNCVMHVCL